MLTYSFDTISIWTAVQAVLAWHLFMSVISRSSPRCTAGGEMTPEPNSKWGEVRFIRSSERTIIKKMTKYYRKQLIILWKKRKDKKMHGQSTEVTVVENLWVNKKTHTHSVFRKMYRRLINVSSIYSLMNWSFIVTSSIGMNNSAEFEPVPYSADSYKLSNCPPLLIAPIMASLDLFSRAGDEARYRKQRIITGNNI